MQRWFSMAELFLIVGIALLPLVGDFPYRLNIFLSYEGAYRLYLGQVPYRDFGIPLGFMYWVVPAVFFKIFGPTLFSLVKAQVLLNIVSGLSFRWILKSLQVEPGLRLAGVLLYVFSFSFLNYWPWYNHTVIVYEIAALAFLMHYLLAPPKSFHIVYLLGAALLANFSFFTKQDGGGMAFLIMFALLAYDAWQSGSWKSIAIFAVSAYVIGAFFIIPFLPFRFHYWFNHGQPPHSARVAPMDLAADFFAQSQWIKFYALVSIMLLFRVLVTVRHIRTERSIVLFALLTLGMLVEAAIFQVTSYVPQDNNIFFHSFAFVFILSMLVRLKVFSFQSFAWVLFLCVGILLWWSQSYWRYAEKMVVRVLGKPKTGAGIVNKNTYLIAGVDSSDVPVHLWQKTDIPAFERMLLPPTTIAGMKRILQMQEISKPNPKVLNMSELTPLAAVVPYTLETGSHYPLWYHQGVGMFQTETTFFCKRIHEQYYDLVIFEYIPYLNNFYPFQVRNQLLADYEQVDRFTAPRKPSHQAWVEVYRRKKAN